MSDLNGETVLQHIRLYKHMPWSHQQVRIISPHKGEVHFKKKKRIKET